MATFEETLEKAVQVAVKRAVLAAHPVGSLYLSLTSDNPSTTLGGGTWTLVGSGKCLWGADSSHAVGSEISAGLPNITGSYDTGDRRTHIKNAEGAFYYRTTYSGNFTQQLSATTDQAFGLDASLSNSIYGNSSTVQPPALVVCIWKRVS